MLYKVLACLVDCCITVWRQAYNVLNAALFSLAMLFFYPVFFLAVEIFQVEVAELNTTSPHLISSGLRLPIHTTRQLSACI